MGNLILWLTVHRKQVIKAVLGLFVGILLAFSVNTYRQNKILSDKLETA